MRSARRHAIAETDVTVEASTQAAVDLCISAFGGLQGVINCAGIAGEP